MESNEVGQRGDRFIIPQLDAGLNGIPAKRLGLFLVGPLLWEWVQEDSRFVMERKMHASVSVWVMLLTVMCTASIEAGKYNTVLSIGDSAPAWSDLPGVDGQTHSLSDLKESPYVVVVFFSNSCDVAEVYEGRIKKIVETYGGEKKQVAVVAINVSKEEEDLLPAMKKRANSHDFNFSYLFDESQQIAKEYGAIWTPEFFVLNRERQIVYMGGYDDTSAIKFVKHHYLMDALKALTNGKKPDVQETPAIGCLIKFERKRQRRRTKEE